MHISPPRVDNRYESELLTNLQYRGRGQINAYMQLNICYLACALCICTELFFDLKRAVQNFHSTQAALWKIIDRSMAACIYAAILN
jgi:hypothetical protein